MALSRNSCTGQNKSWCVDHGVIGKMFITIKMKWKDTRRRKIKSEFLQCSSFICRSLCVLNLTWEADQSTNLFINAKKKSSPANYKSDWFHSQRRIVGVERGDEKTSNLDRGRWSHMVWDQWIGHDSSWQDKEMIWKWP